LGVLPLRNKLRKAAKAKANGNGLAAGVWRLTSDSDLIT
jgi:hypothetical protein